MFSSGNKTVDLIGQMNFEGNVIPFAWFSKITFDNGKPDLNAIMILSEVVYWYRPKIMRDERSGSTLGTTKKFKSDMLQRSYDSFANQFGLSSRQVKYAIDRLCKIGVLKREFRTIVTEKMPLSNVVFLDIDAYKLAEITNLSNSQDTSECTTLLQSNVPPSYNQMYHPPTSECKTYTETTNTETTNTDIKKKYIKKKKFSFRDELLKLGADQQLVDDFCLVREKKKAVDSLTAFKKFIGQQSRSGMNLNAVLELCIEKSWKGFEVSWLKNQNSLPFNNNQQHGFIDFSQYKDI